MTTTVDRTSDAVETARRAFRPNWVDIFLWGIRIGAILVIAFGLFGSISQFVAGEGLTLSQWRNLLVASLSQGAMYGLLALGYSMVYGVLGFINFAHGEVFMSGAMVGFIAANWLFDNGVWNANPFLAIGIVLVVAMLTSTLVAVLIERIAYRPLRGAPRLIPLITSIGVSFFLQYTFAGLFGVGLRTYPQAPEVFQGEIAFLGGIDTRDALVIGVAALSMVGLWFFVRHTKTGQAMRAVAEDKEIAGLMGINVDRTIVTVFAVGGAMAGVAGLMWALLFRGVSFFTGFIPGIKAFTAAVLGGIGNMVGAMGGGILLGLFEGLGPLLILDGLGIPGVSQLKDVIAFAALVLVLVFRPSGLFGERLGSEDRA
ncbi:MAG TPA: branched-chain amino acid ABC transporter permease [Acidimicrobiia bacterium]|nr:branched-chain amino acid ABC transporter permease [Acidimicrobiia bacterium]